MKKLALLFAGLSLFVATGCNNDDDTPAEAPLVGVWQPLKEVITTIETGEQPISDLITYTDCQKQSRWRFNTEVVGKRTEWNDTATPGQCAISSDRNFNYTYDKGEKTIQIKYQGTVEPSNGKIITLNETTLNLSIREETSDPTVYKTRTYTFKRIPQ
ncbi:lipocalin family protein [Chryseobacterium limigenitum]|uniref:Lipocalin-like domain-containing protein n=1 Tax=Chryseobacterium limigenitum TaxID=1612149 RepID=A0A1K2ITU1_9FLAO|nr:lipocalin family protein [Chryseobacterium limigenitum]SFZ95783.1 Lipocalin-like domain-containing protein [Chryseobacterium limigenitum]